MKNAKVEQFENKNQFIIKSDESIIFQSYNSTIAIIDRESWTLTLGHDWDYSHTTLKHLYLFIYEYTRGEHLYNLRYAKNKKSYMQKLIDDKIVNYDESL